MPESGDLTVDLSSPLLAIDKAAGVRSHPNRAGVDQKALVAAPFDPKEEVYRWTEEDGTERALYLLHRLDAPTSGVILCATDHETAVEVRALFAARKVKKRYLAVVKGRAERANGVWKDRLQVERRGGQLRVRAGSGQPAETQARCLQVVSGKGCQLSLLELKPVTGLTHQLRVQCARRGFPILGDATYGDFGFNRAVAQTTKFKRLALHAQHIAVPKPYAFEAESPLPGEFGKLGEGMEF